ncbi:hypothetical protein NQ314_005416 [Rhamnusium bicolor]|uniref:Aquaporin n=1 Tax=Rhamnusium bicolor TaxID=1586634 RepID=A0AAV8ZJX2_9CUCU|nr:hypothetical protein NQ314_005416 [Rhamnusium bicolor]
MLPDAPSVCVLRVNMNITEVQAFFIEFTATFVLFLTVAGAVDVQNENKHDSTPARIGLMIAGLVFAAEPFTGAGLNPARALSPAVLYNIWTSHWLYHFAPYAGMATAGILYRFVLDSNEKNSLYSFVNK